MRDSRISSAQSLPSGVPLGSRESAMPDTYPTLPPPPDASAPVVICRADGSEIPVRLRLLGYDGCELECRKRLAVGEEVRIHLYRMGRIRARVTACKSRVIEAEFIKECPV
jgi:hypothetical protein